MARFSWIINNNFDVVYIPFWVIKENPYSSFFRMNANTSSAIEVKLFITCPIWNVPKLIARYISRKLKCMYAEPIGCYFKIILIHSVSSFLISFTYMLSDNKIFQQMYSILNIFIELNREDIISEINKSSAFVFLC